MRNGEENLEAAELDLVWGSHSIARVLGRPARTVGYMLADGCIPGARKIYGRWVVSRKVLREHFQIKEAA